MKKLLICASLVAIVACSPEKEKDYVTFSGKITNMNSDSLVVRSKDYAKTLAVASDGTFSDTLHVKPGIYNVFDGSEQTSVYFKSGYEINMTIDTKKFDETVKYTGKGSEGSSFLAEESLLQEKLFDFDALVAMGKDKASEKFDAIEVELNKFYEDHKDLDSTVVNRGKNAVEPMMKFYRQYVEDKITLQEDFEGKPSPVFTDYENYAGGTTSLTDLKGSYVYIDVWATWCAPCRAEIPYLKEVEEEYSQKNIKFVSLSIDKVADHDKWTAMVEKENLQGIQLFADNAWASQFVKDYKINGIPRFILIDKEGNVISADAPRPSSEQLKKTFDGLDI